MKKNWKILLGVGVVFAIGAAAYWYIRRQTKLIYQYTIKPIAFSLLRAANGQVMIKFTVRFLNKSDIEAVLKEFDGDVYIQDIYVGRLVSTSAAVIPAKGYADIAMQITAIPAEVLKNVLSLLTMAILTKDISYRLSAKAKMQSSGVSITVPITYAGTLKQDFGKVPIAV